jgi:hypothetical protein
LDEFGESGEVVISDREIERAVFGGGAENGECEREQCDV